MFKTKEEIKNWLDNCHPIDGYTINDDLTVDIGYDVLLSDCNLKEIPIQFGIVKGSFEIYCNYLTSLEGCPKEVYGDFSCHSNNLTSMMYIPSLITGSIYCSNNDIKTLKGCQKIINGNFYCHDNKLTSLNDLPIVTGELWCDDDLKDCKEYKRWLLVNSLRK